MAEPVTRLISSVADPAANYGIQELVRKIKYRRKLEENYRVLMKDLDTLLKLKADNETRVREQNDKVASNDYLSWRNRASKIHIRVSLLKYDYDNNRHSKGYFQLAALSEEMEKKDNQIKSLIDEGRSIGIFPKAQDKKNKQILNDEFLKLVRIRDFLSLILTYPMKMPDQQLLEKWRDEAQALTSEYSEHIDSIGVKAYRWMYLLSEKPLGYMDVLIPNDILSKIEDGQTSIFNENAATPSAEIMAFASTSKGKQVLKSTEDVIPGAILNLSADLAVDHLIQNLLNHNIHHVSLFTRNSIDRKRVVEKMKAALNRKQKINEKYSRVLWIDVSNFPDNEEIRVRQEIARQLNLKITEDDETEDTDNLLAAQQTEDTDITHRRLIEEEMMRTNHLVFLVDGHGKEKLDPRKVGFPKKTLAGAVVLITTQSSEQENDELRMSMDLEIRTDDHILPWELFCRNVDIELVRSSGDLQKIAVQIVEECGGHLLAIVLVARSLKNKDDVHVWKLTLEKLRYLHPFNANRIPDEMSKVLVKAFTNISLDGLNDKEKLCLACSLYVLKMEEKMADHFLISNWVYNKLAHTQEEAKLILINLVARSILLQSAGRYIQWSEEIYNILKSLLMLYPSSEIRKGGLGLTEPPTTEEWRGANLMELVDNKLSEVPESPNCPELEVLLLQGNAFLMEIPHSFFDLMPKLGVLDLSFTNITSLPSSIFGLKELRELRLKGCKGFMELPPEIGKLTSLDTLDLEGTPLLFLPEQIKTLTNLKELSLSFYKYDEYPIMIPAGVISELYFLRSLSIDVSPEDKRWDEIIPVIIQEISRLRYLRTVSLYIPEVELLNDIHEIWDCRFVVGRHKERIISRAPPAIEAKFKQSNCRLKFVNGVEIPYEINMVMRRTQALFLNRHKTIKNLSEFGKDNLRRLHICIVGECNEIQTLIDEGCDQDLKLEFLCAFYMGNLESICEVKASFLFLSTLALHSCPKLTTILTSDFVNSLSSLSEIIVEDCPNVRSIIKVHESFEPEERNLLPGLRKVWLLYLPELVNISNDLRIGYSLERIGCYACPKLESLSSIELSSLNLKVIQGEKEWWDALKWEEAEWGKEGCPNYLNDIFSPINEEADIMNQLLRDDEECYGSNKNTWVQNVEKKLKEQQRSSSSQEKFFTRTELQFLPSSGTSRDEDGLASEIGELKHKKRHGVREILNDDFLRLMRIRDFLNLILTYPMSMPDQHSLEEWRDEAQALTSEYSERSDSIGIKAYRWMHLLSEKPLRHMEVLIPSDILSKIEDGQASIFDKNAATPSAEEVASVSTSRGKQVLKSAEDVIPGSILNLAADLAVDQLIQNLLEGNIHRVRFITRNGTVQQNVTKMKAALNSMQQRKKIKEKYSGVHWIDISIYGDNAEFQVQQEIARRLHVVTRRFHIRLPRLNEEKMMSMNHLVFLVDGNGKGKLDPRKLGFPRKTLAGALVLITTESLAQENDEFRMWMDLEIRTDDHILPWELFCRNVGIELVQSSSDIQKIAVQIVEECGGHLLAIVLVARSLKNEEYVQVWKRTLGKLRYLHPFNAKRIPDEASKVLVKAFSNISLDGLNDKEKLCLACSLYVLKIEEKMADHILMSSWVYNNIVHTQEEAERVLANLVDFSVLLQSEGRNIQWPKEVYNVLNSLFMLYPSKEIRRGGLGLTEPPTTEEWHGANQIELGDNKLSELPESPNCPELRVLLLQRNAFLMEIPAPFFALMHKLRVLDLSYTSIRRLPSSIFGLEKLTELRLKGCKGFMEFPPEIGKLKSLVILEVEGTPLIFLPEEIKELTNLQELSLSFYKYDQHPVLVPSGVISKLTELFSLRIDVSPEDKRWDEMAPIIIREISGLRKLRMVSLYIPQVELLKHLKWRQYQSCTLIAGRHKERIISRAPAEIEAKFKERSRRLKFINGENIDDIKEVLPHTHCLYLERHKAIKCLSEMEMKNVEGLQTCILGECKEMQTLVKGQSSERPLGPLKVLCAYHMSNLTSICEVKSSFCCMLTSIALHSCPKLTTIFTTALLYCFPLLQELIVEDCPEVSTLVIFTQPERALYQLQRLKRIWLLYLPELVSIFGGLPIAPCLKRIGFYRCPKLQILSTEELCSPDLEAIEGEKEWWDSLRWEEPLQRDEGRLNGLNAIFSPINEDVDIMNQLPRGHEKSYEYNKKSWVVNVERNLQMQPKFS